jgi:hypothetical protein
MIIPFQARIPFHPSLASLDEFLVAALIIKTRSPTDLAAIEKLHGADEQATLSQDPAALTDLWSDDGVKLDAPGGPVVGKKALRDLYEKVRAQYPEFKVLKYAPDYKTMQTAIVDGWAIEVGHADAIIKMSVNSEPVTVPNNEGCVC